MNETEIDELIRDFALRMRADVMKAAAECGISGAEVQAEMDKLTVVIA